jgi:hypothetical protein
MFPKLEAGAAYVQPTKRAAIIEDFVRDPLAVSVESQAQII